MKYRYLGIIMGIAAMSASVETASVAFAAESAAESVLETEEASAAAKAAAIENTDGEAILGEVKSIDDGKITLAAGARQEMGRPEEPGSGMSENLKAEAPSTPDPAGEELEITVTENTVITKMVMNGQPVKPNGENGDVPDKPNGENGAVPDMPDGQTGDVPQMPEEQGQTEELSLEEIQVGDTVSVTLDEEGNALSIIILSMEMGGNPEGPQGQSLTVDSYNAVHEYTEDETVSDASLESNDTDENAALISNGAKVTFLNDSITRFSSDSTGGDTSSFYGVGAAVLAADGTAYVNGGSILTDSKGGAGLFAYGNGTVYAADTTITTRQDTSGGIHAAGGGTLYAWDLNVKTNGESSAAIRSDRGGGTMVIDGGTYTSNGIGSPAVYCTANIAVHDAELTATGSEAVCIEGLNSLRLYHCNLTGNMDDDKQNDTTWTVILYQSMSGDSEVGNSTFQMEGGTISSQNGGLFYTTNTECTIDLKNVDITYNEDSEFFLQCTGNNNQRGWGISGANGSNCHFTADSQEMKGDIIWDSISSLDFYMTNESSLEGAFINDETYAGADKDGYCNVSVDESSVWIVTGDSKISALSNAGTIIDPDGYPVTIIGTDGTVYAEGDSEYTITVDSYQSAVSMSEAGSINAWEDYAAEKPEEL